MVRYVQVGGDKNDEIATDGSPIRVTVHLPAVQQSPFFVFYVSLVRGMSQKLAVTEAGVNHDRLILLYVNWQKKLK